MPCIAFALKSHSRVLETLSSEATVLVQNYFDWCQITLMTLFYKLITCSFPTINKDGSLANIYIYMLQSFFKTAQTTDSLVLSYVLY